MRRVLALCMHCFVLVQSQKMGLMSFGFGVGGRSAWSLESSIRSCTARFGEIGGGGNASVVLLYWYAVGRKLVGELNGVAFFAFVLAAWILAAQVLCDRGHYSSPCVVMGCRDE